MNGSGCISGIAVRQEEGHSSCEQGVIPCVCSLQALVRRVHEESLDEVEVVPTFRPLLSGREVW